MSCAVSGKGESVQITNMNRNSVGNPNISIDSYSKYIADEDQKGNYFFPIENIPRVSVKDSKAEHFIAEQKPVILVDTELCTPAFKWTLSYLKENLGEEKCPVFQSSNHIFKYFDQSKVNKFTPDFVPSIVKVEVTFQEFIKMLQEYKPGGKRVYYQHLLSGAVGPTIVKDFINFNWPWLSSQQKLHNWGPLTSNLLLIGMEGNLTPVHYDEQQNFFCQLVGFKRCLLFHPKHYRNLYPHPIYHPHDRQSQVDLEHPDFKRFPRLKHLKGMEAILGPGDVLYIPIYWWHHIYGLNTVKSASSIPSKNFDSIKYNVSINFWYKGGSMENIEYPLLPRQKLAMMRNIEKIVLEALKDPKEVGPFLSALVIGRYFDDEPEVEEE